MKIKKKLLVAIIATLVFTLGAVSVYAYSGDYSFEISYAVYGTNAHSLANKATSTNVSAESYASLTTVSTDKFDYSVELKKSAFTKYSTSRMTANDKVYIQGFGIIPSGSYTVNVYKNTGTSGYVIGDGTIQQ